MSLSTRSNTEPRIHETSKVDPEKAGPELANVLRQLFDLMAERGRLMVKKENEKKQLERKRQEYNNLAAIAQFQTVEDSMSRHTDTHRKILDSAEKDLNKVEAQIKKLTDNYVDRVVKAIPFSDIKIRQVVEAVKKDLNAPAKSITDDRFEKLEKQFADFAKTQKAQADDLAQVKKENEKLRAQRTAYEAQATELATLKTEYKHIKDLVDSQSERFQEVDVLEQKRNQLAQEVSNLRDQLESLSEQAASQQDVMQKALEDVKSHNSRAILTDAAWKDDLKTLKERVDSHDGQLSSFDEKEYTDAMEKLVSYPDWNGLLARLNRHEVALQTQGNQVAAASGLPASLETRLGDMKTEFDQRFKGFSDMIVETCSKLIERISNRTSKVEEMLKDLESKGRSTPRAASTSVAGVMPSPPQVPSAGQANDNTLPLELKKSVAAIHDEVKAVQAQVGVLRRQAEETRQAHEVMIYGLDSQFKNMSTIEMAGMIMENIKRLNQSTMPLDVQNLHDRLATLEEAQQKATQNRSGIESMDSSFRKVLTEHMDSVRNIPREQFVPRKRQRVSGPNGIENGHAVD